MRATLSRLVALLIVVTVAATLQAQGPQATGQAIRGRVVSAETGQPLPNTRVAVNGTSTSARADLDGRFALRATQDATLVVARAGFVRLEESLASHRPLAQPFDLRLTRAAAVAGRVSDEYGDPVVGAMVSLASRGDQTPSVARSVATDDRGDYRIGGLRPGSYTVSLRTEGGGKAIAVRLDSIPEMRALVAAERDTALARERQAMQVLTTPSFTTFYPGTADAAEAALITLAAGDERSDIDFHVAAAQALRQTGSVYPSIVSPQDMSLPANGTASIRGTIISSTGRALPHAVVLLADQKGQKFLTTTAGNDGRYAFESLRPDSYWVAASKQGYSLPPAPPGVPTPGVVGRDAIPVVVAPDEVLDRMNLTLQPWGSITGHVFDEAGEPVSNVSVGLLLSRYDGGRRRLVPAGVQRRNTDDRGEFRLFAIPDGQYVLGAYVAERPANSMGGYATTFYPGSSSAGEVRFITVAAGDETRGLDFNLALAPTASVSGRLLDPEGRPTMGGRFTLLSRSALGARTDAIINADGTFEFRDVPPGAYVIQADRGKMGGASVEGSFAAYPVTVGGSDVTGLTVQMSTGTTLNGRMTYDSLTGAMPPRTAVTVSAIPADFDLAPPNLATAEPAQDGTFVMTGITGVRRLQATRLPPGWMVKSIVSDGIDVTDQPLEFGRPGQTWQSFEVALTDRVNVVSGTLSDDRGRRVGGARVVIFSADHDRWYPASRFVRSAETREDGTFSIAGMPTGSYFVAPALRVPAGDEAWRDPALLDSLRPAAKSITVGEGDAQTVNLRISSR